MLFKDLDQYKYLFLDRIQNNKGNELTVYLTVGKVIEQTEDLVINSVTIHDLKPIIKDNVYIKVIFPSYVAYSVRWESYTTMDDYDVYEGRKIREYSKSRYLEYVKNDTIATAVWPGKIRHFGFCCEWEVIDIVSIDEPEVKFFSSDLAGRCYADNRICNLKIDSHIQNKCIEFNLTDVEKSQFPSIAVEFSISGNLSLMNSKKIWIEKAILTSFIQSLKEIYKTGKGRATLESLSPNQFEMVFENVDSKGHIMLIYSYSNFHYLNEKEICSTIRDGIEIEIQDLEAIINDFEKLYEA